MKSVMSVSVVTVSGMLASSLLLSLAFSSPALLLLSALSSLFWASLLLLFVIVVLVVLVVLVVDIVDGEEFAKKGVVVVIVGIGSEGKGTRWAEYCRRWLLRRVSS